MATPTVLLIDPVAGPTGGRALVKISGTNFQLPPSPPPMVFGVATPTPPPTVQVLFGNRPARQVSVMSSQVLHVLAPISNPGPCDVTVLNLEPDGTGIPGESVTVAGGYTFVNPTLARKPSQECTLQRVVRGIILELQRQILPNTVLTTHTDFTDMPSGANIGALANLPGLVLSGPRLFENRQYSLNTPRTKQVGSTANLFPPRTVDVEFTLIGVDELQQTILALMHECTMFFTRNIVFSLAVDPLNPDGDVIEYDMDLNLDSHFGSIGSPGNSNIHAFSGTFRIKGVDVDDDDARSNEIYPLVDGVEIVVEQLFDDTEVDNEDGDEEA